MVEPVSLLAHLRGEGYHSRSSKHGDAMVRAIVEDLMAFCPKIAAHVASDQLVYSVKHKLIIGTDSWNTDLAIGTAPQSGIPPWPRASPAWRSASLCTCASPLRPRP